MKEYLEITNEDNLELMARYPDNHFDLAIVDPPYGINESSSNFNSRNTPVKQKNGKTKKIKSIGYKKKDWDKKTPDKKYFNELFRISKNQIIFGVQYFAYDFSSGRIIWDKINGDNDFSDCEIAFCSLITSTRQYRFMWNGMCQGSGLDGTIMEGNKKLNEKRIHPTQKPVALYDWLIHKYAKKNDKILDTHLGSGSIAIAVDRANKMEKLNLTLTACELDKEYFDKAIERIEQKTTWQSLF